MIKKKKSAKKAAPKKNTARKPAKKRNSAKKAAKSVGRPGAEAGSRGGGTGDTESATPQPGQLAGRVGKRLRSRPQAGQFAGDAFMCQSVGEGTSCTKPKGFSEAG